MWAIRPSGFPVMKTAEIRAAFLEFFRARDHAIVPSSSLVPASDPTLLFTNSGMVQFKNVFLGSEKPAHPRAADVQRCLRAGGKHNDLDSVGYTARHHTFFEMLGNWSFGDYFKREAIDWAWEFLTGVLGLDPERLWVTVYHSDDEAWNIWHDEVGVPSERIIRIGDNKGALYASDNFWQMADTGPCGPCTEIFYDHGAEIPGGPPGSPEEDGDRYIEIWNLVFMQFDRAADGSLSPLPAPCVDTGMGLERLAAVLQGRHSNYEIDLFQRLIAEAARLTDTADLENQSLRVIADHIRACAFLIVDGVLPSNEGRGYVLRRIIRRALRHGWMLGQKEPFFHAMLPALIEVMGEAYPELAAQREPVAATLLKEEQRFAETLEHGMKLLQAAFAAGGATGVVSGQVAFTLYDTYGFPVDLTADVARERGWMVDLAGFEAAMDEQRRRARSASRFAGGLNLPAELASRLAPTEFLGYRTLAVSAARVLAILREGEAVEALAEGEEGALILDRTPFYAESGGQVGDTGRLSSAAAVFSVEDTVKLGGVFHAHLGRLRSGALRVGDELSVEVDAARRQATVLNHSATHLLHAALREVLGRHVQQKGSLVAPDRLRFDFSHPQALSAGELRRVEDRVNEEIRRNDAVEVHEMAYQEALDFGALALFGEKYGDRVRVLRMGEFSTELCGGTHVGRSGDIGLFKIVAESGVAAGVRRIEALTGAAALAHVAEEEARLERIAGLLAAPAAEVVERLQHLSERQKRLERELESLKARAAGSALQDLAADAREIGGLRVVAARIGGLDARALREGVDLLKQRLGDCVIVLASAADGKVSLAAGAHGAALARVKAGEVVAYIAGQIGGKGGGRADFAQGGGIDSPALDATLAALPAWLSDRLR